MKKPKQVFKKKEKEFNPFGTIVAVNTMATYVQVEVIKSQPHTSNKDKTISIAEAIKSLAESTKNAAKYAMLFKFRTTGRYVR